MSNPTTRVRPETSAPETLTGPGNPQPIMPAPETTTSPGQSPNPVRKLSGKFRNKVSGKHRG